MMRSAIGLAAASAILASCAAGAGDQPVSATNDELVLRTASAIQVRDTKGELLHSFGRAVASPDGSVYYALDGASPPALQWIEAKTGRPLGLNAAYSSRVRVYDVPSSKLSETLVIDVKLASQTTENNAATRLDGIMNGIYQSSVPSRDGQWNFSFYYNPSRGPFIHVLHLNSRNAFCILDLPIVPGGYQKRLAWSLALAPSGTTLYAANGALGMVSAIDATTLKVRRTATIAGLPSATTPDAPTRSVVSPDGRKLYFP